MFDQRANLYEEVFLKKDRYGKGAEHARKGLRDHRR